MNSTELNELKRKREKLLQMHECTDCLEEKHRIGEEIEKITTQIEDAEERMQ